MRGWIWKYLRIFFEIHFRPALLGQAQSRIARIFPRLEIKFIFDNKSHLITVSREVWAIAVFQYQI